MENVSLLGTYDVHEQISVHIFPPNGDYCLCIQYGELIFELGRNLLKRKKKTKYLCISEIFLFSVPYFKRFSEGCEIIMVLQLKKGTKVSKTGNF